MFGVWGLKNEHPGSGSGDAASEAALTHISISGISD